MRSDWTPARTYSTADLCALIPSVSPRQLQWWDERLVVTPRQEAHRRIYTLNDALEIAVIADLRRKGLSLQRIRTVLRLLQREIKKLQTHIANGGRAYVAITGRSVVIETSPERLLDTLSLLSRQCYVVDVVWQLKRLTPEPRKAFRAHG